MEKSFGQTANAVAKSITRSLADGVAVGVIPTVDNPSAGYRKGIRYRVTAVTARGTICKDCNGHTFMLSYDCMGQLVEM